MPWIQLREVLMTDPDENANVADESMKNLLSHVPAEEAAEVAEDVEAMTDITDEMIEAAAVQIYGGPHHRYKAEDGGGLVEYTVAWNEVIEKLGIEERVVYLRQARRILEAALAGRTVVEQPELITIPKFQGCTDSNPDLCACGEAALMCAACNEEIEDGAQAYTVREKCCPWLLDADPDQQWQDAWWHASCDERSGGSQVGDQR